MRQPGGARTWTVRPLLLVLLALLVAVLSARQVATSGPAAAQTPAVQQPIAPLPSPPPPARLRLVVLGDSVPAGTACGCPGFGAELAAANRPATLVNDALPGLTSSGLLAQLASPGLESALRTASLVTVTIGANDFNEALASDPSCGSASCYAGQLQRTTATLRAISTRLAQLTRPGTPIALTGYWNVFLDGAVGASHGPTYVATSDALTRQFNTAVALVARRNSDVYVDLYAPFKGDGTRDDTTLLAADGDHPDAAGHLLIAGTLAAAAGLAAPGLPNSAQPPAAR